MTHDRPPRPDEPRRPSDPLDQRDALLRLCYRLLGSLSDAEDAVQETYIRWFRLAPAARSAVASPRAWLTTAASRIALDMLGSARARRERYVGAWLPEPVPASGRWSSQAEHAGAADPADRVTLDESVSMALLVVMESMTAAERVAFVLHDVFRYPFAEVAEIVGRSPEACRQLASSARRRIDRGRRDAVAPATQAALVRAFRDAWQRGDVDALVGLLDPAARAVTDGGGAVSAAVEPIDGADAVARFLVGVLHRQPGLAVAERVVNGEPGLVATADGRTLAVIALDVDGAAVRTLWAIRNPEKLRAWN